MNLVARIVEERCAAEGVAETEEELGRGGVREQERLRGACRFGFGTRGEGVREGEGGGRRR